MGWAVSRSARRDILSLLVRLILMTWCGMLLGHVCSHGWPSSYFSLVSSAHSRWETPTAPAVRGCGCGCNEAQSGCSVVSFLGWLWEWVWPILSFLMGLDRERPRNRRKVKVVHSAVFSESCPGSPGLHLKAFLNQSWCLCKSCFPQVLKSFHVQKVCRSPLEHVVKVFVSLASGALRLSDAFHNILLMFCITAD